MDAFDYSAPADFFPGAQQNGHRPVGYRRFATAAEAIRYAIEAMPSEFLDGMVLETEHDPADGTGIRNRYRGSIHWR